MIGKAERAGGLDSGAGTAQNKGISPLRILIAEDDPVHLSLLHRTLSKSGGHEVIAVRDGEEALRYALSDNPPDVLILDWVMPKLSGTEVCRRVRAEPLAIQPHVLIVTAKNRRDEVIEGLSVGADDLLCKPIAPDLLLARVAAATRRPTPGRKTRADVVQALLDACVEGNGELVIRDGRVTARVFVHEHRIAWAHMTDGPAFFELLADDVGVAADVMREVLAECRTTGNSLSDTMVRWGLVDRAKLREGTKLWTKRKLQAICRLNNPQMLFLPMRRRYAGDLLFTLDELLDEADAIGLVMSVPPPPQPAIEHGRSWSDAFIVEEHQHLGVDKLLEKCLAGEGVLGVALIDRATGCCSGTTGSGLNPDIAWAHLQSLSIVSRDEQVLDTVLTTNRHYHLVHALPGSSDVMVYAVVDSSRTHMGSARRQLAEAVEMYAGPTFIHLGVPRQG